MTKLKLWNFADQYNARAGLIAPEPLYYALRSARGCGGLRRGFATRAGSED